MRFWSRWFPPKEEAAMQTNALNAATHASAQALILLQQHARRLNLNKRVSARANSMGSHQSRFRGRGMDYQESRIYQAGDDIRNMDWRVTARAGKPHTKLYQEERERPVVFVVDFNPSMFFGSTQQLKSVLAAKTAALLAWAAAAKGDRVGGLVINHSHHEAPPKMGKRGVLQLINLLVKHGEPPHIMENAMQSHSTMGDELKRLRRVAKPGSLVFLISDFYGLNEYAAADLQEISRHNDIQAIQIVDPLELAPPPPGYYEISDGESTGVLNTVSQRAYDRYQQFFQQHHAQVHELLGNKNIPLLQLSTADDLLLSMQHYFSAKKPQANAAMPRKEAG